MKIMWRRENIVKKINEVDRIKQSPYVVESTKPLVIVDVLGLLGCSQEVLLVDVLMYYTTHVS